jgi:hypothetical protein
MISRFAATVNVDVRRDWSVSAAAAGLLFYIIPVHGKYVTKICERNCVRDYRKVSHALSLETSFEQLQHHIHSTRLHKDRLDTLFYVNYSLVYYKDQIT